MSDEKIYQRVQDELDGKPRKFTDKALMTKAKILCEGDEEKIKYTYMKLRVEKLKNEEAERLKRENQKQELIEARRLERELQQAEEEIKHKKNKSELVLWVQLIAVIILIRILSRYVVIGFGAMAFISILIGYITYNYSSGIGKSSSTSIAGAILVGVISYVVGALLISGIIPT
jgi:hypothetical protein